MASRLDRKYTKLWQLLKGNAGVKSSSWFKKADAAVSKKIEAYRAALAEAQSGTVDDLLKFGEALRELDETVVSFAAADGLGQVGDSLKKAESKLLAAEIARFQAAVQHEKATFESRLRFALSAADNDLKRLEAMEANKKKELWKGFGIDL